jgi:hypothetical protein
MRRLSGKAGISEGKVLGLSRVSGAIILISDLLFPSCCEYPCSWKVIRRMNDRKTHLIICTDYFNLL